MDLGEGRLDQVLIGARGWGALHTAGQYYLWLIFAQTYLGRLLETEASATPLALAVVASVMALRLCTRHTRFDRRTAGY